MSFNVLQRVPRVTLPIWAMEKTHTVLNDFDGRVPRGSGLEELRGYKSYEEHIAVFTGMKPSRDIPPWKQGKGPNEPYMLFFGTMEIWADATVRLQMKDGRKFTLTHLDVHLEDQFPRKPGSHCTRVTYWLSEYTLHVLGYHNPL